MKKKISSLILFTLSITIHACSNNLPASSLHELPASNNFNNQTPFTTKDLSESYIARKINQWISAGKGDQLLKELLYAQYKYPDSVRNIVGNSTDPAALYNQIISFNAVSQRMSIEPAFGDFIRSLSPSLGEFQVNTFTQGLQWTSSVGADSNGNFVVAWTSQFQDGSGNGIYVQKYNSDGSTFGSEFRANTTVANSQELPTVAMDNGGDFIIVWDSQNQDGEGTGVYGKIFYPAEGIKKDEFRINQVTSGYQFNSAVAMNSTGNFVATWVTTNATQDGNGWGIIGRIFDNAGNPQTGDFVVNNFRTGNQEDNAVAIDSSGNFVVAWKSNNGASSSDIYARRFDALGNPGAEFRVNDFVTSAQEKPAVAMDGNGDFVIAWTGNGADGYGIYAKKYNANGGIIASDFRVDSGTMQGMDPAVAADSSGNFIVSWHTWLLDGDGNGIGAKIFGSNGQPKTQEFIVNTNTSSFQEAAAAAVDGSGQFIITWDSFLQDGDSRGIYGKRFSGSGAEL
jgi:hypothetical protein